MDGGHFVLHVYGDIVSESELIFPESEMSMGDILFESASILPESELCIEDSIIALSADIASSFSL